jgi:hypothetical protein
MSQGSDPSNIVILIDCGRVDRAIVIAHVDHRSLVPSAVIFKGLNRVHRYCGHGSGDYRILLPSVLPTLSRPRQLGDFIGDTHSDPSNIVILIDCGRVDRAIVIAPAGMVVVTIVFYYLLSYQPCLDPFRDGHIDPLLALQ